MSLARGDSHLDVVLAGPVERLLTACCAALIHHEVGWGPVMPDPLLLDGLDGLGGRLTVYDPALLEPASSVQHVRDPRRA
eukprot:156975-Pyramimonas_sp.AAC.1